MSLREPNIESMALCPPKEELANSVSVLATCPNRLNEVPSEVNGEAPITSEVSKQKQCPSALSLYAEISLECYHIVIGRES